MNNNLFMPSTTIWIAFFTIVYLCSTALSVDEEHKEVCDACIKIWLVEDGCEDYGSGNSKAGSCYAFIAGLLIAYSYDENSFRKFYKKTVEKYISATNTDLLDLMMERVCARYGLKVESYVVAECATLPPWLDVINATEQAIREPENLKNYLHSLNSTYEVMVRGRVKLSWYKLFQRPTEISSLYEKDCSSPNKPPTNGSDIYCEVLKEKLDVFNEECAREPTKEGCEKEKDTVRSLPTMPTFTVSLILLCLK